MRPEPAADKYGTGCTAQGRIPAALCGDSVRSLAEKLKP